MNVNNLKKKQVTKQVKLSLREKKHQANLRKNSGLYFQIGLITTLFVVFGVFQLKFEKETYVVETLTLTDTNDVIAISPDFIIEENIPKKIEQPVVQEPNPNLSDSKIIDDNDPTIETVLETPPLVVKTSPQVDDIVVIDETPDIDVFPVLLVSELPVFPGCEKYEDKDDQFECFSKKIAKLVNRKFNTDVASENGITGKQKITVTFVINAKGDVTDVKARAPHPELQKEAIKAVKLLPKMKPAKQGVKEVNVSYALPIIFYVE